MGWGWMCESQALPSKPQMAEPPHCTLPAAWSTHLGEIALLCLTPGYLCQHEGIIIVETKSDNTWMGIPLLVPPDRSLARRACSSCGAGQGGWDSSGLNTQTLLTHSSPLRSHITNALRLCMSKSENEKSR